MIGRRLLAAAAALVAASFVAAGLAPTSACDFDGFDVQAKLAEVAKPTTAYYACDAGHKCLRVSSRR